MVDGPWVVRKAVPSRPAILGKTVPLYYSRGEGYFEVDIDTTNSVAASRAISVAKPAAKLLVVDMAYVIEGQQEDELPEIILGSGRLVHVSLADGDVPLGP